MLVKCAVQVNQRYGEINQVQFLLLMNFFISCWLQSPVRTAWVESSFSSSFVTSCSGGSAPSPLFFLVCD